MKEDSGEMKNKKIQDRKNKKKKMYKNIHREKYFRSVSLTNENQSV